MSELPKDKEFKEYLFNLRKMNIPDPYAAIETGDQLDMLWAEYFATSRIKPIRQILTALNLSANIVQGFTSQSNLMKWKKVILGQY